jgi:1-acyl-sn-glycerol-3-phosphate acyltransferase
MAVAGVTHSGRDKCSNTPDQRGLPIPTVMLLASLRGLAVAFFSLVALAEILITIPFIQSLHRTNSRARWLNRWCRFAVRVLGVRLKVTGPIPNRGLLVCNHLSYLDVLVLSSVAPCVFVAKRDVAGWPLFGWLALAAGTIFVDRSSRLAAPRGVDSMREAIEGGAVVVLFAEGTSSDGATVLPFKSALLEPALQSHCRITAGAIDYLLNNGSVADEVCYWRDMTLVPHLLNLFTKPEIGAKLAFAPLIGRPRNRKELSRALREQVAAMRS